MREREPRVTMSAAAPTPADDRRHPILARSRPLSQTALEAFAEQAGRRHAALLPAAEFGTYAVREVDAKSALTVSGLPGEPYSLNPYTGCSHNCAYCYVPDIMHLETDKWASYVVVKRNLPRLLAKELARKERRPVYMSSATDPYQPAEATHEMTRRSLELLARADWPLRLLTRSPLVTRDLDLFSRFSDNQVGLSVPTLDDRLRRAIEPTAPPIEGRLRALRVLADAGLRPFANLIPAYPLLGGTTPAELARAFREAGVAVVHAGAWQYLETVLPVVRERLPPEAREAFTAAVADKGYYRRLFRSLTAAFRKEGVPLEVIGPEPHQRAKREIRWVEGASGRAPA